MKLIYRNLEQQVMGISGEVAQLGKSNQSVRNGKIIASFREG